MNSKQLNAVYIALFAACLIMIFTAWIFVRFIHYHSQYRILNPKDYDVQVLTKDDYEKLSNPANQEVKLSDGTLYDKSDSWYSKVLPKYKPVNNTGQYVLVTIKGTAPFVRDWEQTIIPLAAILILALVIKFADDRYRKKSKADIP
jgi:hypothetical protein